MKSVKFLVACMLLCTIVKAQTPFVNFDPIVASTIFSAPFDQLQLLSAPDAGGNLYTAQNNQISKVTAAGVSTIIAGTGVAGFTDGPGSVAKFWGIAGITLDAAGNIYVSDSGNNAIRKITPAGMVSTVAGNGIAGYQDGNVSVARFNYPRGIAADAAGNIIVGDQNNLSFRKITSAGVVSTLASAASPNAHFTDFLYIAVDQAGNLYTMQADARIQKISPAGTITSFVLQPDVLGVKLGLAIDKGDNLYTFGLDGFYRSAVCKIFPSITTVTLAGAAAGYKDSIGTYSQFLIAEHVTIDDQGNIYLLDYGRIRKLSKPVLNLNAAAGIASTAKYFAISGNYLKGSASLQAPAGFELSQTESGPYSPSLNILSSAGEIRVANIYVRVAANAQAGIYADSVVLSSAGAVTKKIAVSATVSNTPKKLVIIGSGTSACIGLDPSSVCYVGRLKSAYNKITPLDTTIDNSLARGSTNCYNGMPSSYVSPYSAATGFTPIKEINITAALALNPDAVLVNYPTNGYDVLSVSEIMFCLRTIRDSANKKGVPCYITTTQPRTSPVPFNTAAMKLKLAVLKDSILAAFGSYAVDFWTGLINPADSSLLYDQGDRTNMNAAGHNILYQRVLAANVFAAPIPAGNGTGLLGAYFNNKGLTDYRSFYRLDASVNNDWGTTSPVPNYLNDNNYSVRWTGQVVPQFSETYTFYSVTDDGARVFVNGIQLIDNWSDQAGATEKSGSINLVAGYKYNIVVEYYKATGNGVAKLLWSSPHTSKAIIPSGQLYPPQINFNIELPCAVNTAPANGAVIATATSVNLSWTLVPNASQYEVFVWTGAFPIGGITPVGTTHGNSFTITGLTPSTAYNWVINAINDINPSANCFATNKSTFTTAGAIALVPCVINTSPANAAVLPSQTSARLTWPASAGATSYDVYLATGNAVPTLLKTNTTALTYYATGLTAGTLYSWYIAPRNANGANTACGATNKTTFTTAAATGGGNIAPVANAGSSFSITLPVTTATLNGTASYDPNGSIAEYYWYQAQGPVTASITNFSVTPAVTGLTTAGTYIFGLQVKDNNGVPAYSSVTVTVKPARSAAADARIAGNTESLKIVSPDNSPAFAFTTAAISPNPVKRGQAARLQINSDRTGTALISLTGSNGQQISNQRISLLKGINNTSVSTAALAQGLYLVNITGGSKPFTVKLIVY